MHEKQIETIKPIETRVFRRIMKGDRNILLRRKDFKNIFRKTSTIYFILISDDIKTQSYIDLVKRHKIINRVSVDYDELRKYREFCSCLSCFLPCMRLAIKNKLVKNISWKGFLRTWQDGYYSVYYP